MKVAVTVGPETGVAAPVEVCDLDKLGVAAGLWIALPDGRFLVGRKNENEGDITRYNLVLDWAQVLKKKVRAER
jgi:hypothetical protein